MKKNIKFKKYTLEPYNGSKSRHTCPNCGDKHSFTYYIDIETYEPLGDTVGRCNHENSCGYHLKPSSLSNFDYSHYSHFGDMMTAVYAFPKPDKISFFNEKYLLKTETNHSYNNFIKFLLIIYDYETVSEAINRYRVGSSNYWKGATVFWYINKRNQICSGKVMQYDKSTGKRAKLNGVPLINSMRKILQKQGEISTDFNQGKCFFGEHLIVNNNKAVNIVESEKTAIIANIQFPQFVWLASGSRSFLTKDRIKVLKGKAVTLYPDNDAYEDWGRIASKNGFKLSTLMKSYLPGGSEDLADWICSKYNIGTAPNQYQ